MHSVIAIPKSGCSKQISFSQKENHFKKFRTQNPEGILSFQNEDKHFFKKIVSLLIISLLEESLGKILIQGIIFGNQQQRYGYYLELGQFYK